MTVIYIIVISIIVILLSLMFFADLGYIFYLIFKNRKGKGEKK